MMIFILVLINVILLLLHNSTDPCFYDAINNFIDDTRLRSNAIHVDVYSETNDTTTGRDNRLAIVRPFNWYILNSRGNIYVLSTSEDSAKTCNDFIKLNNPLSGRPFQNTYKVCLPVTISSMMTHFANKTKTRIYIDDELGEVNVLDIVNKLLLRGAVINYLL